MKRLALHVAIWSVLPIGLAAVVVVDAVFTVREWWAWRRFERLARKHHGMTGRDLMMQWFSESGEAKR